LLGPQTSFTGRLGWHRWPARSLDAESFVEAFRQAFQCQLAVASLRTLIGHHDAHCCTELLQETGPLARTENTRPGDVEDQLHPRVGGIGVLPAWPTARAETPFQLSGWDDQMTAPNP
jgi:hypothetical protein